MCLELIKQKLHPTKKVETRYKVLQTLADNSTKKVLRFPSRHETHFHDQYIKNDLRSYPNIRRNVWMKAEHLGVEEIYAEVGGRYKVGFHVYKTLKDARNNLNDSEYLNPENCRIFEVKVKMIRTEGLQEGYKVQVCDFLKVVEVKRR